MAAGAGGEGDEQFETEFFPSAPGVVGEAELAEEVRGIAPMDRGVRCCLGNPGVLRAGRECS